MGRKSASKQVPHKNANKENKFNLQKRKELSFLVDKLLKLTCVFQTSVNVVKSWEHHLEIDGIIGQICNLEGPVSKQGLGSRQSHIQHFIKWMKENEACCEGIEISQFEGYDLGLKASNAIKEDSLILTVPRTLMISEQDARDSELSEFIATDALLQNMPNVMLALFLLLEKTKTDSVWKPYIDILPDHYSTVLYYTKEELAELKPSPLFEASLKLYRSITRQYAYFYNKIHSLDLLALKKLQNIFTFENYRWAVSTVMTRQNNLHMSDVDTTAFIPLWDMCNHEHGKITTDFNKELNRVECYALRDFEPGEQIFIFYGARPNSDLFLHNGFVYPKNKYDSLSIALGISSSDPLRETKHALLNKLGLGGLSQFNLYKGEAPISAELLAFIRIFNMNSEELEKWSSQGLPADLVSSDDTSAKAVGPQVDLRAYKYLLTRCNLIRAAYKDSGHIADTIHRKNIKLLKECEVQILDGAIKYLDDVIKTCLPTDDQ